MTRLCQLSGRAEADRQGDQGRGLLLRSVRLSSASHQKPGLV